MSCITALDVDLPKVAPSKAILTSASVRRFWLGHDRAPFDRLTFAAQMPA